MNAKNKILMAISVVLASSCVKPPQQKVELLVKAYLDSTLDDPASYQSVSFGKVDTVFEQFADTKEWRKGLDSIQKLNDSYEVYADTLKIFQDIIAEHNARGIPGPALNVEGMKSYYHLQEMALVHNVQVVHIDSILVAMSLKYKGPAKAWAVTNKFRAKNKQGALQLQTNKFIIDYAYTKVLADTTISN